MSPWLWDRCGREAHRRVRDLHTPQAAAGVSAPSDAEVRERSAKLIENQHNDDTALEQYERIEHYLDRTAGANPRVLLDKTYRVVPTGGGTMKIALTDQGTPAIRPNTGASWKRCRAYSR